MRKKNLYCKRCKEIIGIHRKYINTLLFCERCYWLWKKNLKSKDSSEFNDWVARKKKPAHPWSPEK